MVNRATFLNEHNFKFSKTKGGITPGAFGCYTDSFGNSYNVVLKLSTPNLNGAKQHTVECFASEVLLRLGQRTLPIVKVSVSEGLREYISQCGFDKEWYGKEVLSDGTIKIDFNTPNTQKIETMYEIGKSAGVEPVRLRTIDGCVDAIKKIYGKDTPLVNGFLQQQLSKIFINNNDYNIDDMFSVVTYNDGSVAPLPIYDLGSSIVIGAFSKQALNKFGVDGNTLSHDLSFGEIRTLNSTLYNQGTAMGTTMFTDNWWNDVSQKQLVEYICKTYPDSAKEFYAHLTTFDEEDIFYICDTMQSNGIVDETEKTFLTDFMWARQEEMMTTMQLSLFQDVAQ